MDDDPNTDLPKGIIEITFVKPAKLFIDGRSHGEGANETKTYEVAVGTHELHAESAWCGSQKQEVVAGEGETVSLTVDSFSGEGVLRAAMMLLVMLFMMTKTVIFLFLAGLVLVRPFYYVTIGSDRYLRFAVSS